MMGSWGKRDRIFRFFFNAVFLDLCFHVRNLLESLYSSVRNSMKENRSKAINQFLEFSLLSCMYILRTMVISERQIRAHMMSDPLAHKPA
jgi:hypothetical protein